MPGKGARRGRPGALDEARELVALVSSLSEAGDALSAEAVASRLGVSAARAEKLVRLVLESQIVGGSGLPLVEEGGEVTLVASGGVRGRRLRLSRAETLAVIAALERLGVTQEDPLRERLEASLSPESLDGELAGRLAAEAAPESPEVASAIAACAQALAGRAALSFMYRKAGSDGAERRLVEPRGLRTEGGAWYLDALDLQRRGERTFRLDRMDDAETQPLPSTGEQRASCEGAARMVRLTFRDPSYLDLLPWHDLRVVSRGPGGEAAAETPYYGGSWLPRMLCACAGTASTDDPELAEAARDLARALLAS